VLGAEEGGEDGLSQSVEVTDDALALRIPLGPDDSDNHVVGAPHTRSLRQQPFATVGRHWHTTNQSVSVRAGLALDTTSTQVPVPHPLDPEAEDLPPAPVLLVATSDGKLRFYAAGHLRRPMQGVVRPPKPLPPAPALAQPAPAEAEQAPASAAGWSRPASADEDWVRVEQAAAVTALPSDGDGDEDDGNPEDEKPPSRPPALPQDSNPAPADEQLRKAAAAGLPPSSDDDEDTEPESNSDANDAMSRLAAGRMQMPSAQSAPQPAAAAIGAGETGAGEGSKSAFGPGPRLSPAGAAAAARHAASSQPAVSAGGSVFGRAFSFAAPAGQPSGGRKDAPGFNLSGAFGGPRPSAFSMPAFGQSTPVLPPFSAPPAGAKAPAAPAATSAPAPAAVPSKKVQLGSDPDHTDSTMRQSDERTTECCNVCRLPCRLCPVGSKWHRHRLYRRRHWVAAALLLPQLRLQRA